MMGIDGLMATSTVWGVHVITPVVLLELLHGALFPVAQTNGSKRK